LKASPSSQNSPTATVPLHLPALVHMPFLTQSLEHGVPAGLLGFCRQLPSAWQVPIEHGDTQQPHAAPTRATLVHLPDGSTTPAQHSLSTLLVAT
jgi:hypothetical protein